MSTWERPPEADVFHPNMEKLFSLLGKTEGADVNTIVGGGRFTDMSQHPNIVGLRTKEGPSTAAGFAQITKTTYDDVAPRLGITDFSEKSQKRIAQELVRRSGAYDDIVAGDFERGINKLGGVWASLPSSPYSQPKKDWNFVRTALASDDSGWERAPSPAASDDSGWERAAPAKTQAAPQTASAAPAAPQRSAASSFGLGTRNVLEGVEQAFTYPVRAVGEAAAGVAGLLGNKELSDTLSRTLGMKNKGAGALAADAAGLAKPETKTEKVIAEGTKAAAGLLSGSVVNKLAEKSPEAVKGVLNMLLPGTSGTAGQVAKDVGIFGTLGASMEAAPAETAAGLALLAGGKAAAGKVMTNRAADKIISKAGTNEGARLDAEIIQDLRKVVGNGNRRDQDLVVNAINDVGNRYVGTVKNAVERVDPSILKKIDVEDVLSGKKTVTGDQLMDIMGTPAGDALASAITKYQRLNSLTQQQAAGGSIPKIIARGVIAAVPASIGSALGGFPGAAVGGMMTPLAAQYAQRLTGKASRAEVTAGLLKRSDAADEVLKRLGPSQAGQDIANMLAAGRKAEATQAAKAMSSGGASPVNLANLQQTTAARNALGLRGSPTGGAYDTVLKNAGVTNEEAIPILRKLSKDLKGTDIGEAATRLRKSMDVPNEKAFFDVQNILRDIPKGGALSQASTVASGKGSSVSKIVSKLSDDQVATLAGRSADTLDKPIGNLKGYLTTRASRALETYKKAPDKLPAEDLDLLKALGVI